MRRLAAVALVVGCGNNSHHSIPVGDAPPGHAVLVTALEGPDFIAYRSGDGPWQTPPRVGSNGYQLTVADDYVLLLVCDGGGSGSGFDAEEAGLTFTGDGASIDAACNEPGLGGGGTPITVTGTMAQAGRVQLGGGEADSGSAAWTYSIDTTAGVHDVLAIDVAGNAVFDHAINFGSTGPAIDTAANGAPLVVQPLEVDNLGNDPLQVSSDVVSTDFTNIAAGSALQLVTLPLSELGSDDLQVISVTASNATGLRHIEWGTPGAEAPPSVYDLLPPFTTATFKVDETEAVGSWVTLPDPNGEIVLVIDSQAGNAQAISASPSFLSEHGLTSLEFDASAPGYLDAWKLDPAQASISLDDIATIDENDFSSTAYGPSSFRAAPHDRPARHHAPRRARPH